MVQLRRMPLATMSPASTPSLLNRCRLGLRIKEFIHSPVAASTDLLFGNRIFVVFFALKIVARSQQNIFRNNFPCHQVRQKSFVVRAVIITEIINIPPPVGISSISSFISSFFPGTRACNIWRNDIHPTLPICPRPQNGYFFLLSILRMRLSQ